MWREFTRKCATQPRCTRARRRPHEWNLGPCGRTKNCTHANGTVFNIRIRRTRLRSSTQHPLGGDRGRLARTKPTRRGGRRSHREHCRWLSRREWRGRSIKAAIGRHSGRLTVGHGAGPPRAADRCRPWDGPPDAVFYTGPAPSSADRLFELGRSPSAVFYTGPAPSGADRMFKLGRSPSFSFFFFFGPVFFFFSSSSFLARPPTRRS